MRVSQMLYAALCVVFWANFVRVPVAHAHSLRQKLGAYGDSHGLTRQRVGYEAKLDTGKGQAAMSASNLTLGVQRDTYVDARMSRNEYMRQVYGQDLRMQNTVNAAFSQTWNRLTETRILGTRASDGVASVANWGGGVSHWLRHETLRVSIDASRTLVRQPRYEVLDFDSQLVGNPPVYTSTGGTLAVRALATPTTILETSGSYIANENRPPTRTGLVSMRQFIPAADAAVHTTVVRSLNRGRITTATEYGQVDASIFDVAWLQNMWAGAVGRLGFRYYVEDETTRVRKDRLTTGTDTFSLGLSQDLPGKWAGVPLTLELAAARYLTNTGVSATSGELGAMARF